MAYYNNNGSFVDVEIGQDQFRGGANEFAAKQKADYFRHAQQSSRNSFVSNRSGSKIGMGSKYATMRQVEQFDGLSGISGIEDNHNRGTFASSVVSGVVRPTKMSMVQGSGYEEIERYSGTGRDNNHGYSHGFNMNQQYLPKQHGHHEPRNQYSGQGYGHQGYYQ